MIVGGWGWFWVVAYFSITRFLFYWHVHLTTMSKLRNLKQNEEDKIYVKVDC